MIQRAQGAFRMQNAVLGVTMIDQSPTTGPPVWSPGNTAIDRISLQPPNGAYWEILSYAISGGIILNRTCPQLFGKFGKVRGALVQSATPTVPGGADTGCLPLPLDATTVCDLWDPQADPMPPVTQLTTNTLPTVLPLAASVILPQPISLTLGDSLGIGLWMAPMLFGFMGANTFSSPILSLVRMLYTVTYDDGKPTPSYL